MRIDRQGDKLVRVPDDQLQEKSHFPFVFEALSLPDGEVYVSEFGINHEDAAQEAAVPVFNMASPVVQGAAAGRGGGAGGGGAVPAQLQRRAAHPLRVLSEQPLG